MQSAVCSKCHLFFHPHKNGVLFEEGMPRKTDDGKTVWYPYKLWVGDEWICHGCKTTIIIGMARNPVAEHYQPDYAEKAVRLQPKFRVNDC